VWVRPGGRNIAPAVEALLRAEVGGSIVVIEAGDLPRSAPLRTLCEKAPAAAALPCYADEGRGLSDLVDEALRGAGLSIGRDARAALLASLGGDRQASRSEIAKLVLYAHGRAEISLDDVDAVLSDVSSLAADTVVDAAFAGDPAGLEAGARRLAAEGLNPAGLLAAALRHAFQLLAVRLEIEAGKPLDAAIEGWRGLHFRRKPAARQALQRWTAGGLTAAAARLQAAILDTRRLARLDDTIAARVLLDLARRRPSPDR
jgi:DNA polymerase-3 subunit delta